MKIQLAHAIPSTLSFVVVPSAATTPRPTGAVQVIVESLERLANSLCSGPNWVIGFDQNENKAVALRGTLPIGGLQRFLTSPGSLPGDRIVLLLHPSFLIGPNPNFRTLVERAADVALAVCVRADDLYAFAAPARTFARQPGLLEAVLRELTAIDRNASCVPDFLRPVSFEPFATDLVHSPTASEFYAPRTFRLYDAPTHLNQAFSEMLASPAGSAEADLDDLAALFLTLRNRSRVPWIFNEFLNELEFRRGWAAPQSFPPEFHLSLTGACNIECKFCSYTHTHARSDMVTPELTQKLSFLRHVRTMRLHSGNGEPTANPHLAKIVAQLSVMHPQLGLNFFTNGVLLGRKGLIPSLVDGAVSWISVSLNAATRETWRELCGADQFERLTANLDLLLQEKRARRSVTPVAFGSMVLTRRTVGELPLMPELCRKLGIDRFTAIPFFALGYTSSQKYGAEEAYHHIGRDYTPLYEATVSAAKTWRVSVELPMPQDQKTTAVGIEKRVLHDFARIELHDWRVGKLLNTLWPKISSREPCPYLWRQAAVGSVPLGLGADTHYLYPCLGPLATVQMVKRTAFRFPDEGNFADLWRNSLFTELRQAQSRAGLCPVCDHCRCSDTRDPKHLPLIDELIAGFTKEHGL